MQAPGFGYTDPMRPAMMQNTGIVPPQMQGGFGQPMQGQWKDFGGFDGQGFGGFGGGYGRPGGNAYGGFGQFGGMGHQMGQWTPQSDPMQAPRWGFGR